MRALLGERVLASRPYRVICDVKSDWTAVAAQLAAGNLAEALRLYRGPLLPRSQAPGVMELRADLDRSLRAAGRTGSTIPKYACNVTATLPPLA